MTIMYSSKPVTFNSDEKHYENTFKPIDYRGFKVSRSRINNLYYIIDQDGQDTSNAVGFFVNIRLCQARIDEYIDRMSKVDEKKDTDDTART